MLDDGEIMDIERKWQKPESGFFYLQPHNIGNRQHLLWHQIIESWPDNDNPVGEL